MWRTVAIALLVLGSAARADRKEAGPDTPPLAEVVRIELELGAPPNGAACQPATWTINVDLARGTWQRSDRRCQLVKGKEVASTATRTGALPAAVRAEIGKRWGNLDARVPKFCENGTEQILQARLFLRDSSHVTLVDRGCEKSAYLRELAAAVTGL